MIGFSNSSIDKYSVRNELIIKIFLSTGKRNGWLEYGSSTHFTPCPKPDHHACLDQFETDGNIQFQP